MTSAEKTVDITVSYRGKSYPLSLLPDSTLHALQLQLEELTSVPPSLQKLLFRGKKATSDDPNEITILQVGLKNGVKVQMLGSTNAEVESLMNAEDAQRKKDRILRERALKPQVKLRSTGPSTSSSNITTFDDIPNLTSRFHQLVPLPHLPNPDSALDLLRKLSEDPAILHVMQKHEFSVGVLTELAPHEHPQLLGLNVNKGQQIKLRLRTNAYDGFRLYSEVRKVLCHELTHNVWGDHDENFKELNSKLNREVAEYERAQDVGAHRLGGDVGDVYEPYMPSAELEAQARAQARAQAQVLGSGGRAASTSGDSAEERRQRILDATMKRLPQAWLPLMAITYARSVFVRLMMLTNTPLASSWQVLTQAELSHIDFLEDTKKARCDVWSQYPQILRRVRGKGEDFHQIRILSWATTRDMHKENSVLLDDEDIERVLAYIKQSKALLFETKDQAPAGEVEGTVLWLQTLDRSWRARNDARSQNWKSLGDSWQKRERYCFYLRGRQREAAGQTLRMSAKTIKASNPSLKQGTLGFASKRTGSTNLIGKEKKPIRTLSTPVLRSKPASKEKQPASPKEEEEEKEIDEIELIESTEDEDSKTSVKKRESLDLGSRKEKHEGDVVKVQIRPRRIVSGPETSGSRVEAKPKQLEDDGVVRPELDFNDSKWKKQHSVAKEKMGGLKTIHGDNQTKVHEILRVFDLSYEYGPCIGMTRLERWERAAALGLNPPSEIREILQTKQGATQVDLAQDVFHDEV
ncbi:WLM-domain-containing protein [Pluteus cervinus]|uniref:WLM-domain-containing protein n=1 Tax=Pluteus cervinus TaxID=181527 RepID=A0ACD3B1E9_9AGAR|nr:WLM-domain-containing protein [Pluteus cervinus]